MAIKSFDVTDSSMINHVSYDDQAKVLTLRFCTTNASYNYEDVPESVYEELKETKSKGAYIGSYIKGRYVATRVD